MRLKAAAIAVLLALAAARARAQTSAGGESFDFLLIDADARGAAMGGALSALASGTNALLYNPAGLSRNRLNEASFTHSQYAQDLTQENIAFASPLGFGADISYLSLSNIPRSTLSEPAGVGSNFGVTDVAAGAGYGHAATSFLSLGGAVKYLRETIDTAKVNSYAFDLGALYDVPTMAGLSFGAALQNIGPNTRYQVIKEKLPANFRLGAAYSFRALGNANSVSFDATKTPTDKVRINLGFETWFYKMLALRVGYSSRYDGDVGVTAGLGWSWQALAVDYAIVPMGDLGIIHRVGLSFRWGSESQTRRDVETPEPAGAPLTPEERFARARGAMAGGNLPAAKRELAAAVKELGPGDRRRVFYYSRSGLIALRENNIARAQTAFMEALKLSASLGASDSSVADAYYGMGMCLLSQNDGHYALKFFTKSQELGPSSDLKPDLEEQLKRLGQ